ncbi:MAG: hypothetical protein D6723_03175 [Acidobacteria bacterium]|nr:MAG: hypothetical protein D6723_03175 [Acidobacteriota bacterium]
MGRDSDTPDVEEVSDDIFLADAMLQNINDACELDYRFIMMVSLLASEKAPTLWGNDLELGPVHLG